MIIVIILKEAIESWVGGSQRVSGSLRTWGSAEARDLLDLEARFDNWRATRKYIREPVPDELRNAALEMVSQWQNGVGTGFIKTRAILPK